MLQHLLEELSSDGRLWGLFRSEPFALSPAWSRADHASYIVTLLNSRDLIGSLLFERLALAFPERAAAIEFVARAFQR